MLLKYDQPHAVKWIREERGENNYRVGNTLLIKEKAWDLRGQVRSGDPASLQKAGDSGQNFLSTYRCALRKEFSRSVNLRDAGLCKAQEMTLLQDFLVSFIL